MAEDEGRDARRPLQIGSAVLAVLAVVAGVLLITHRTSGPDQPPVRTARVAPAQLDELAREAPCELTPRDEHPAAQDEVARVVAAAVVRCHVEGRIYPGQGEWQVLVRQVSGQDLGTLMAALTAPDVENDGVVCGGVGYGPLPILLADATGHFVHPRAPTTVCGAPQDAVLSALDGIRWRTVSVTRIVQTRTPIALRSGCPQHWKSEFAMYGSAGLNSVTGDPVLAGTHGGRIRMCLYRLGGDPMAGNLVRADVLTGEDAAALRAALAGLGPTGHCAAQRDFAVATAGDAWAEVELGGCWRVVRADASPAVVGSARSDVVRRLLRLP